MNWCNKETKVNGKTVICIMIKRHLGECMFALPEQDDTNVVGN